MSGAFYGSLATSASVFVAILTALLVNTYVQIKSDRRHTQNELHRIEEELKGLRNRRDDYQNIVNRLVEKREADYREKAKKQVNTFIESEIPSKITKPIEQLSVNELYQKLIDFHDSESAKDLEDSPTEFHHKELLEEQIENIENKIVNKTVSHFALKYRGDLTETRDDTREQDSEAENEESKEDDDPDIVGKDKNLRRDPLQLHEFIEKYKQEYNLDSLDERTKQKLRAQYEEVVDKNPSSSSKSTNDPFRTIRDRLESMPSSILAKEFDERYRDIDLTESDIFLGLSVQEQQKLKTNREKLQNKNNEIEILEQRQGRLKREKERLHPEDLVPTLVANVATIILSVVVPIIVYLLFVTNSALSLPNWLWIISHTEVNVFLSWFLGLCIVFESIYARISNREPRAYSFYRSLRKCLSRS